MKWKILARHKNIVGVTITESCLITDDLWRRYTATIRGFQKFLIYEGYCCDVEFSKICDVAYVLRCRIDIGDESLFKEQMPFIPTPFAQEETIKREE